MTYHYQPTVTRDQGPRPPLCCSHDALPSTRHDLGPGDRSPLGGPFIPSEGLIRGGTFPAILRETGESSRDGLLSHRQAGALARNGSPEREHVLGCSEPL